VEEPPVTSTRPPSENRTPSLLPVKSQLITLVEMSMGGESLGVLTVIDAKALAGCVNASVWVCEREKP